MLTKKENLIQTMTGGSPDRFVNQYEFLHLLMSTPIGDLIGNPNPGEGRKVNAWGVTMEWAPGQPGMFPPNTPDLVVIKDLEDWKDYVHYPEIEKIPEAAWEPYIEECEKVDKSEQYVTYFRTGGLFEQSHHLGEISNICMGFYEYPDEMHELYKWLLDFEMRDAEMVCSHLHPDAVFHHDDWGSQLSTFMSPDMFAEFFLEPYRELYKYYRELGVELIIHHSDSYAATLVPYMIEMGIDIWQGAMSSNNVPELVKKYGKDITIMGGIDTALIDNDHYTREKDAEVVKEVCDACGPLYFIPCSTAGDDISTFPGAKEMLSEEIAKYSEVYFKEHGLSKQEA